MSDTTEESLHRNSMWYTELILEEKKDITVKKKNLINMKEVWSLAKNNTDFFFSFNICTI